MAGLNGTITIIKSEYRPCIVKGRKALFHCWEDKSEIHNAVMKGDVSGVLMGTVAIVEYENGDVRECYPYEVKFLDNKLKEYDFRENEKNDKLRPYKADEH